MKEALILSGTPRLSNQAAAAATATAPIATPVVLVELDVARQLLPEGSPIEIGTLEAPSRSHLRAF